MSQASGAVLRLGPGEEGVLRHRRDARKALEAVTAEGAQHLHLVLPLDARRDRLAAEAVDEVDERGGDAPRPVRPVDFGDDPPIEADPVHRQVGKAGETSREPKSLTQTSTPSARRRSSSAETHLSQPEAAASLSSISTPQGGLPARARAPRRRSMKSSRSNWRAAIGKHSR